MNKWFVGGHSKLTQIGRGAMVSRAKTQMKRSGKEGGAAADPRAD